MRCWGCVGAVLGLRGEGSGMALGAGECTCAMTYVRYEAQHTQARNGRGASSRAAHSPHLLGVHSEVLNLGQGDGLVLAGALVRRLVSLRVGPAGGRGRGRARGSLDQAAPGGGGRQPGGRRAVLGRRSARRARCRRGAAGAAGPGARALLPSPAKGGHLKAPISTLPLAMVRTGSTTTARKGSWNCWFSIWVEQSMPGGGEDALKGGARIKRLYA
jgi:hypothetical protein